MHIIFTHKELRSYMPLLAKFSFLTNDIYTKRLDIKEFYYRDINCRIF